MTLIYVDPPVRRTASVVRWLRGCPDQVASTQQIADGLICSRETAKAALLLLQQKARVEEIHPGIWHLA